MTVTTGPAPVGAGRLVRPGLLVGGCLAVAVVSLLLPVALAFDPWAWLVWGREVGRLELDTTGGPSWKPLPVAVTTLLSAAGGAAPALWLVVARTASLLAAVGAFRLASRLAGRWAGAIAAVALVLTPDGGSRFLRLVAEGHSATIGATFGLWSVERHLAGARSQALLLLTGLALLRPEAWPFAALYAAWTWQRDPARRPLASMLLVAIPLLWFGGDLWGSGDPWHGADAAQVASGGAGDRLALALERAGRVVPLPVWVAAVAGVLLELRRGRRVALALAAAAGAWTAVVVGMAALLGYAALSRFYLPAGALVCVLAGTGAVRIAGLAPAGRARIVVAAALTAASLPWVGPRVDALDRLAEEARARHRLDEQLDAAISDAGGRESVLGCGTVAIDQSGLAGPLLPGLAWKLDVPLGAVRRTLGERSGVVFARAGGARTERLEGGEAPATVIGRSQDWVVYAVGCDPAG